MSGWVWCVHLHTCKETVLEWVVVCSSCPALYVLCLCLINFSSCEVHNVCRDLCGFLILQVQFKYWGMQSKVERFIHDYALRRVMLRAHCQAWAWQDEWVGLTMEDIRRLERETQIELRRKLGRPVYSDEEENGENGGGYDMGGEGVGRPAIGVHVYAHKYLTVSSYSPALSSLLPI